ncbi:5'/3'-nucleotidase SurE [Pontibacillus litoralis]|uniref:5'-nucleotidase SurE n=1 Tax=Pontibacillus litoralis JSM 072002 TaxID=1385512 RepID=A0A0A5G6L6_9BACI|nr:5'/3'-nucleotidase SurE [Pontibacillus litoralis]KGX86740.1 stationary phase survival protein SurE [Pontibacillus litoralis JSM 072002]
MRFLVTNDDGIHAKGVSVLVEVLKLFGDVYVVCPDQERSAASHSITLRHPIKAEKVHWFGTGVQAWSVNGTTADCVKLALDALLDDKPDYVISGINIGPNLGRDWYYSGTISGAVEGALYNIPSLAVSLAHFSESAINFNSVKELFYQLCEQIFQKKFPNHTLLNVNIPHLPLRFCQGVAVVPFNKNISRYQYVGLNDPQGQVHYWLKDKLQQVIHEDTEQDYGKLRSGCITVTPVNVHQQQQKLLAKVERWFTSFNKQFNEGEEKVWAKN